MKYVYRHLIPQNIAPKGAQRIAVHDASGSEVCTIPLGRLKPPDTEPLYRFGLVSDLHVWETEPGWGGNGKFSNALTFFQDMGCDFCAHAGDMTQTGFYLDGVYDPDQMAVYKSIVDAHSIPVYGCCGNHESYEAPITDNLAELKSYTGFDLYYQFEHQGDVFIFCGHPAPVVPMSDEAFAFLAETLAENRDRRCFVFVHPVWRDDSGDVAGIYAGSAGGGPLLSTWSKGEALKALLAQYPNVVLFHGHTHIKFQEQEKDKSLNYTDKNGFHSVHIPSVGRPRDVIDGALVNDNAGSQGYVVDVHEGYVVLRGWDLAGGEPVALGTIKIST